MTVFLCSETVVSRLLEQESKVHLTYLKVPLMRFQKYCGQLESKGTDILLWDKRRSHSYIVINR